jgi:hypothetical protein
MWNLTEVTEMKTASQYVALGVFLGVTGLGARCSADNLPSPTDNHSPAEKPVDHLQVISKVPVSVLLRPDEQLRIQIGSALDEPDGHVRLAVQGILPPPEPQSKLVGGVKVFLNLPDASAATSEKDRHFVGVFSLQPTSETRLQGVNLDLTPTLRALQKSKDLDLGKPLSITLIAIPSAKVDQLPDELKMPFREVSVTVPSSKK